jgi:hypothetical protein
MIDIICTQRIKPGMEEQAEKALREAEKQTLANDKGGRELPAGHASRSDRTHRLGPLAYRVAPD